MGQPPAGLEATAGHDVAGWMLAYGPALRRYFRKKVGPAEAEDLVQDVFVAMQARGPLQDTEHVNRYLFRVAANVVAKRHRPGQWDWASHAELDEAELQDALSPERSLIARQTLDRLLVAMRALPPRSAQAFALHRFDEMTYGEIAAHMGISIKAVEALMKRALEKITALVEAPR
jgi:RNA polymerase sigma factor (sigma-70 family)